MEPIAQREEKTHCRDRNKLTNVSKKCVGKSGFVADTEQRESQYGKIFEGSDIARRRRKNYTKSNHHL